MEGGDLKRLDLFLDEGLTVEQLLPKPTDARLVLLPVISFALETRNAAATAHLIGKGADVNRMSVVMTADKKTGQPVSGWQYVSGPPRSMYEGYDLYTPLMHAAAFGFGDGIRLLIDRGADVNAKGAGGMTALMIAARHGGADVVRQLVAAGAVVDAQLKDAPGLEKSLDSLVAPGATALWLAARAGLDKTVEALLDAGADAELAASCDRVPGAGREDARCSAGRVAELAGHPAVAALIRSRSPQPFEEDLDWLRRFDEGDESVGKKMSAVVGAQDTKTLTRYLAAGLDVDAYFSGTRRETLLLLAAGSGAERVMSFLLARGADYEKRTMFTDRGNERGRAVSMNGVDIDEGLLTPLMVSARAGCRECLSLLLAAGADVNAVSPAGQTALHLAAEAGHTDAVTALLGAGAEIDAAITSLVGENAGLRLGATPLWFAARNNHPETVGVLLEAGADPAETAICASGPIDKPVVEKCTPRRVAEMEKLPRVLDVLDRFDVSE